MTFCTAFSCMDGRIQLPVIEYLQKRFKVKYVDMITEPGASRILAEEKDVRLTDSVFRSIEISVDKHKSSGIAVVGHYDCAGNPVSKEKQLLQLQKSADEITKKYPHIPVVKLWVNEHWQVQEID